MDHEQFRKYLEAVQNGRPLKGESDGCYFVPGNDSPNTRAVATALLNLIPGLERNGCSILTARIGPIDPNYAEGCDVISVRLVIARAKELSKLLGEDSK